MELIMILTILTVVFAFIIVFLALRSESRSKVNFGPEDALDTCIELISCAEKQVKIVTDLTPKFFEDDKLLTAFKDALRRGVVFNVLHDPGISVKSVGKFSKLVDESKNDILVKKMESSPPYHFWVVDETHLRIEKPHPPRDLAKVEGEIKYKTLKLGLKYEAIFDTIWMK